MTVLVLVRHGESEWTPRHLFTGWSDPPLSDRGERQARRAGAGLAACRIPVDQVYTSLLSRATQTASIMMAAAGARPVAVEADWRLNERHLGRLEGLTKAEVRATWGNEWRKRWRDDDFSRPPSLHPDDRRHPRHDLRYRHLPVDRLPGGERRGDTESRVLEFWHERVVPAVLTGHNVIVVSHLGPLRVLARHLGHRTLDEAPLVTWPHGEPRPCRMAARPCCVPGPGPR